QGLGAKRGRLLKWTFPHGSNNSICRWCRGLPLPDLTPRFWVNRLLMFRGQILPVQKADDGVPGNIHLELLDEQRRDLRRSMVGPKLLDARYDLLIAPRTIRVATGLDFNHRSPPVVP